MPDASAVMQLLLKTQTDFNDLEDDDPQVEKKKKESTLNQIVFTMLLYKPTRNVSMFLWFRSRT